ncbi:hypothetical protein U2I54_04355 [Bacillus pseudomycoides]|uniref:Tail assembly chaperone n=1 Tax=Bacillus bingmayongensis TaxID=1150157 RepID=A0ABU5JT77_9BACI|nr:hypothetical protein [Bacillus pseudomycoides]
MARLSDLVNVDINRETITIQKAQIPVIFTMEAFPYIEEASGKQFHEFQKEMEDMLNDGEVVMGEHEIKLMRIFIYAMIRAGGTECTLEEVKGAIPLHELPDVFQAAVNIFNRQNFQIEDMEKLKKEKK